MEISIRRLLSENLYIFCLYNSLLTLLYNNWLSPQVEDTDTGILEDCKSCVRVTGAGCLARNIQVIGRLKEGKNWGGWDDHGLSKYVFSWSSFGRGEIASNLRTWNFIVIICLLWFWLKWQRSKFACLILLLVLARACSKPYPNLPECPLTAKLAFLSCASLPHAFMLSCHGRPWELHHVACHTLKAARCSSSTGAKWSGHSCTDQLQNFLQMWAVEPQPLQSSWTFLCFTCVICFSFCLNSSCFPWTCQSRIDSLLQSDADEVKAHCEHPSSMIIRRVDFFAFKERVFRRLSLLSCLQDNA